MLALIALQGEHVERAWSMQDVTWLLGSLCRIQRIPFDAALLARQYPPPHSEVTFVEAATALGFRIGRHDTGGRRISAAVTAVSPAGSIESGSPGGGCSRR